MEGINVYSYIISLFQEVAKIFSQGMVNALVGVLRIDALMTAIGMIVIIIFAIKKMQDNDLFTIKTGIAISLMLSYLGFFNWAVNNPTQYYESVSYLLEYPAETLSQKILQSTAAISPTAASGDFRGGIDVLIQQALSKALELVRLADFKIGLTGLQGSFTVFLLACVYFICNLIFTILVIFIILVAVLQVMIWKSLSIIFLLFMFLPQTRGMVGKYIMFVITLTMYKPMVLTVAFFNTSIGNYITTNVPSKEAFENGNDLINLSLSGVTQQATISGYITLGIIGCFICVALVKQVPEFISNVVGTSTSLGKGMATAATGAMALATGAGAAASVAAATAPAKAAYQGAGGGLGGIVNAAAGIATMGLSNKLGGNKLGEKINDVMNKSKAGNFTNNALSKGISAGTNTVKSLGKKMSGK